jgi:hypothetical protein
MPVRNVLYMAALSASRYSPALVDARRATGARNPSLPLSEAATRTLFALYPDLAPKGQ